MIALTRLVLRPSLTLLMLCGLALLPIRAQANADGVHARLAAAEARLVTVATRLALGSADQCRDRAAVPGWLIADPLLYAPGQWPAARNIYGAGDDGLPFIAALAVDGVAARAGLTMGMALHSIGGVPVDALPVPGGASATGPHRRMAAIDAALRAHEPGAPLHLEVGTPARSITLAPPLGCASEFRVEPGGGVIGKADGRALFMPLGLMEFADSEPLLAAVTAHEFAHNILRHRSRLTAAGVASGMARQFGRSARLSRLAEVEADRLSLWLLAGAGYDAGAAADFWTRYGRAHGKGVFQAATHPRWRSRVAAMAAEAAVLAAARDAAAPSAPLTWPHWALTLPPLE